MTFSDIRTMGKEDLLEKLGLVPQRSVMDWIAPGLGLFAVGLLVGAGLGLVLAPKSGAELRANLANRIGAVSDRASGRAAELGASL